MPRFEIDVDEKGEFAGTLPAEIDAILKRIEITAHGTGFRSGQGKATEDAKKQIEDTVKAERAKWEAQAPLEREKWQMAEEENKTLKTQITETMRESDRNLRKREEAHAEELTKRVNEITKRDTRIRELVGMNIRALAMQNGAREDALPALEAVLQNRLAFDDDMQPFFKDESGNPATQHGKAMTAEAFVKVFLGANTYFLRPTSGQGGGARGGASFHQGAHSVPSAAVAAERISGGDRSATAINELFEAGRKKRAS
jgi:hypothetical protein